MDSFMKSKFGAIGWALVNGLFQPGWSKGTGSEASDRARTSAGWSVDGLDRCGWWKKGRQGSMKFEFRLIGSPISFF
jgi:hypothetical protein